jgi:hypothetical protein
MERQEVERRTAQLLAWTAASPCCPYFSCQSCHDIVAALTPLREQHNLPATRKWWDNQWEQSKGPAYPCGDREKEFPSLHSGGSCSCFGY